MSSNSYHDQFSQIQDSLHKRLEKIAKQPKRSHLTKNKEEVDFGMNNFGIEDDLNLSNPGTKHDTPLNSLLETANQNLNSEIRELKNETGRLRKYVSEKEYEVVTLNKKIRKFEEERIFLAGDNAVPAAAPTKIIELSKKNRDLNSVIEVEKNKSFRFQQKILDLETKLQNSSTQKSSSTKVSPSKEKEESAIEQLQVINMKLVECRNQLQSLKQELKIAHKVLAQETGEEIINLVTILKGNSQGYRGRAVQIKVLQTKVKELERKLKGNEEGGDNDKNFKRIKMVEKTRRENIGVIKTELEQKKNETQEVTKKWESSRARNKVLAADIKSLKSQVTILTGKGQHDNELIDTLMKQQEKLQGLMQNLTSHQTNSAKNEVKMNKKFYEHEQQATSEVALLKSLLEERDKRVRELETSHDDSFPGDHTHKNIRDSVELGQSRLSARKEKPEVPNTCSTGTSTHVDAQLIRPATTTLVSSNEGAIRSLELKCGELTAMLKATQAENRAISQINNQLSQRLVIFSG